MSSITASLRDGILFVAGEFAGLACLSPSFVGSLVGFSATNNTFSEIAMAPPYKGIPIPGLSWVLAALTCFVSVSEVASELRAEGVGDDNFSSTSGANFTQRALLTTDPLADGARGLCKGVDVVNRGGLTRVS